ncbi:MAG: putative MAP kinase kinase family domain protein [Streblomastix strix]|uniref:non-specific serine/threonine protein kinase n=1 Tax=Streblomastix strix TaxID=222440 RepID=A0A5J4W0I6_9EUKA|nr:MAG: putative MAP kinase kinase family domain protein [Streblomastix strix]
MALSGLGNNDFRIRKKLSHGAKGRTYLAELLSTQELFAMKKEEYLSEEDKARVQLQIDQMKRLTSKFTVRFVYSYLFDVDMCIVMELCENNLRNMITELQKLSEPERVTQVWVIVGQVTRSLDHLHTNNVVHRKIKPENIYINTDGSIRLGCFGVAQPLNEKDCLSMGSAMIYMAPEVWLKKRCDFFSDIFSCGIIAAELLTGKHPFFANNELAIVERIKKGQFDQLPAFVPNDLKELIESMIDVDYFKRPTTKQIMGQSTIDRYHRIQLEKEKELEVAQKKVDEQAKEIARLQSLLAKTSKQHEPQTSSMQVIQVPAVDEQGYQSYQSQPDPQYLQSMQQQHAYQQANIPQQKNVRIISSVPTLPKPGSEELKSSYILDTQKTKPVGDIPKSTFQSRDEEITVGIADESVRNGRYKSLYGRNEIYKYKTVEYYRNGYIHHIDDGIKGNSYFFEDGCRLGMEVNMDSNPRTLTFFVKNKEQTNYVIGIPESVRFMLTFPESNSEIEIDKLTKLSAPTALHGNDSISWDYSEEWIQGDIKKHNMRLTIENITGLLDIGICDSFVRFNRNEKPVTNEFEKIVQYNSSGWISHIGGKQIQGNKAFDPKDEIILEFDMLSDPKTLTFFVNSQEQKNYVTELPSEVRFWRRYY